MGGRNTTQRRRDRGSGHIDPYYQRRCRYRAALGQLGLWDAFSRMDRHAQDHFVQFKLPDPVLAFGPTFPDTDEYRPARLTLEKDFRKASVKLDDGSMMDVRDVIGVAAGTLRVINYTRERATLPEEVRLFMRQAGPVLTKFLDEYWPKAFESLCHAIKLVLFRYNKLDTRLLSIDPTWAEGVYGKQMPRIEIGSVVPEMRNVRIDGESRPMYRMTSAWTFGKTQWLSWTPQQLGLGEGTREYPVYVQKHALRQLQDRVNLPEVMPYLQAWLAESLSEPRVSERHGQDLLVQLRINDYRLGYLVVTLLDDIAAVRTFKFLTMSTTPESRMLEKRLALTRHDLDWLGLHDLAAFTQTDLSEDPVLRPMLEECGCGHLFKMKEEDCTPAQPKAFAAEMRKYLRMAA